MTTNYALASNGGVATATSSTGGYPPSAAIDGDVGPGAYSGSGACWAGGSAGAPGAPQILTVMFSAVVTISQIALFTWNFTTNDPGYSTNQASPYGIKDFIVQLRVGGTWTTVVTTTGNAVAAIPPYNIAATNADGIQVLITNQVGGSGYLPTVVEMQAFGVPLATAVAGRQYARIPLGMFR